MKEAIDSEAVMGFKVVSSDEEDGDDKEENKHCYMQSAISSYLFDFDGLNVKTLFLCIQYYFCSRT